MATTPEHSTISAILENAPADHQTVANFEWPDSQPNQTYTIDIHGIFSLRLDEHTAVRPTRFIQRKTDRVGGESIITDLFGESFAASLSRVHQTPDTIEVFRFKLDLGNRLAIAHLQYESPSTPVELLRVLGGMIGELSLQIDELNDKSEAA